MKQSTIDLGQIKHQLVEKLRPSGWANRLKGFLVSSEFDQIIEYLYNERESGRRFVPVLKTMFTAFEKCPYDKLKVVIVSQDPYPFLEANDGMAFSCSAVEKPYPALDYIMKAVDKTIYDYNGDASYDPDLTRWAEQGVLLLNTSLSVELNKPGSHKKIWQPFMAYLLDTLNTINSGLVFIYVGKKTLDYDDFIDEDRHYKLYCTHPASATFNNQQHWDSNNVFLETNRIIKDINNDGVTW